MRPRLISLLLLLYAPSLSAQDTRSDTAIVRGIADRVLAEASFNSTQLSPYNDWRYWNGVLNLAMLRAGDVLTEAKYIRFARDNIAFAFATAPHYQHAYKDEDKWSYPFGQFIIMKELDDYGAEGASLLDVQAISPTENFLNYAHTAGLYIRTQQGRLPDGTLVRTFPRKWTLWADDLFMGVPFLARMGRLTGDTTYYDDGARQVVNYFHYLYERDVGLLKHDWYSDTQKRGVAFWGRANGWAVLAEVELLDLLPRNHPQRDTLLKLLNTHVKGIARWQGENGLWHQLLDKDDSFEETSASAMFTYALAHAVRNGWIDRKYGSVAEKAWAALRTRVRADAQIVGICAGTGVSDKLEDYYNRPTPLNDPHGVGTVLLAGAEILRLRAPSAAR